jgi:hypothetical protein
MGMKFNIDEPCAFDDDFTTAHAHRMLDFYCKKLTGLGYKAEPYDDVEGHIGGRRLDTPRFATLNHALWMCDQTRIFLRQGRLAKAYRWIGMTQGILWMNGLFSIVELKDHNRFEPPPVGPRGR